MILPIPNLIFDRNQQISFMSVKGAKEVGIELNSFLKHLIWQGAV